jgi:hypothetical protein
MNTTRSDVELETRTIGPESSPRHGYVVWMCGPSSSGCVPWRPKRSWPMAWGRRWWAKAACPPRRCRARVPGCARRRRGLTQGRAGRHPARGRGAPAHAVGAGARRWWGAGVGCRPARWGWRPPELCAALRGVWPARSVGYGAAGGGGQRPWRAPHANGGAPVGVGAAGGTLPGADHDARPPPADRAQGVRRWPALARPALCGPARDGPRRSQASRLPGRGVHGRTARAGPGAGVPCAASLPPGQGVGPAGGAAPSGREARARNGHPAAAGRGQPVR